MVFRLIFGEADGLPGLIVDYYVADDAGQRSQLVCQFMAAGVEAWKEAIVAALTAATGCPNVYERSDVSIREKEGLEQITGVLAGEPPSDPLIARAETKLLKRADKLVVLADSSKFTPRGSLVVCPLSRISTLITDDKAPKEALEMLREAGVQVMIVAESLDKAAAA